jgi:hypothetical protein
MRAAVEASDRLGRNWPPPAMIVPCRRMTGIVTASERIDFGSRRFKIRLTEGDLRTGGVEKHVGIRTVRAMPQG